MWWGIFYLGCTLATAGYVLLRKADLRAIVLVLMAWIVSNEVEATNTLANMLIDAVFLLVVYRWFHVERQRIWAILALITVAQLILHGLSPLLDTWYYLAVRNILYFAQLPVIAWRAGGWSISSLRIGSRH